MKTLLSIALFLSISLFSRAQYGDSHFGVKAGLNISSLDVKNGVDYTSKAGFNAGVLEHIHFSPHFGVQPEVDYSQQGGKTGDQKWNINYINVPVLFQYMTGNGLRLQTGPQLGVKVSSKIKNGDVEVENHDVNALDVSWPLGAGYIFASGIGVDARYNIGLTNVNSSEPPEVRNRVFQADLFYQLSTTKHKK